MKNFKNMRNMFVILCMVMSVVISGCGGGGGATDVIPEIGTEEVEG